MSQVRSHLNPDRAGTHCGFPSFVQQCSHCKQEFIEEHVYDAHKVAGCAAQPQIRGDIVLSWGRLYLALFPDATRIPLPWADATGWLPDSELRRCRAPLTNSAVSSPFLGDRQSTNSSMLQTPPSVTNPPDQPRYDGAVRHMLDDVMNPMFIQANDSPTSTYNHRRNVTSLQTPSVGMAGSDNEYFLNIVQSFQTNQRAIRRGAVHLTAEQLLYMAEECEQMFDITRGMYRQQSTQPSQAQLAPAINFDDSPAEASHSLYMTPVRPQNVPNAGNVQYLSPSASSQPSSHGYNTGSSQYIDLNHTQPSSTSDPRYLTPDSCANRRHRRISVPSPIRQDTLQLRRALPSRLSLPDESPSDDDDTSYYDSMRRSPRRRF